MTRREWLMLAASGCGWSAFYLSMMALDRFTHDRLFDCVFSASLAVCNAAACWLATYKFRQAGRLAER